MGNEQRSKKKSPPKPDFSLLQDLYSLGYKKIVGLDEVGRGAIAGPIVVAAIELPVKIENITDSKLLSRANREYLFNRIIKSAPQLSIGTASNEEIDQLGISAAQALAYERALHAIDADLLLTDFYTPPTNHRYIKSIKGDQVFYPTAAASIAAKVYRDQLMRVYDRFFPDYGWRSNVGYGTKQHLDAISSYKITNLHRVTFLP
jgi:ribonuclease HII